MGQVSWVDGISFLTKGIIKLYHSTKTQPTTIYCLHGKKKLCSLQDSSFSSPLNATLDITLMDWPTKQGTGPCPDLSCMQAAQSMLLNKTFQQKLDTPLCPHLAQVRTSRNQRPWAHLPKECIKHRKRETETEIEKDPKPKMPSGGLF